MTWAQQRQARLEQGSSTVRGGVSSALPQTRIDDAWAQLWFAIQRYRWSTLALVPANPAQTVISSATELVAVGRRYRSGPVELIDAISAEPERIDGLVAAAASMVADGAQVIIAVDSPLVNPAAIAIVRTVGAALLVVPLGETKASLARRTIESIGREQFLGSFTVPCRGR